MIRIVMIISLVFVLASCDSSVRFEKAQPEHKHNLDKIPKRLQGTYKSNSGESFLTIDDERIVDWVDLEFKELKDSLYAEIDSTEVFSILNDEFQYIKDKDTLSLIFFGDSVLVHYTDRDTIFEVSGRQVLRRYKGHYFLNYMQKEGDWVVKKLSLNKKDLSFQALEKPEDISMLEEITEVEELKSDSGAVTGYRIDPTRQELKQLVNRSFTEMNTYKKVE